MNQPEFENLLQTVHTRDLTDAELAKLEHWLAANPDEQDAWAALDRLLVALPDASVKSQMLISVLLPSSSMVASIRLENTDALFQRPFHGRPSTAGPKIT